ncbi:hypothetical protein pdam_00025490 [Pocillopora damicornis]|uniref:BZIP domain-containing protein n=3 Tax=Pocillopora TaxID=46730 RepID=A0A3M6TZZ4_POCDA|nr:hypothetical protein pdam_00025490 [Pocillopora damicornis]
MQCLTENALVQLIPVVGPRMKFIKQLESLKKTSRPESIDVVEEGTPIANEEMEVQDRIPADTEVKARKRKRTHSLTAKRRQRLARNKRKREERQKSKTGLELLMSDLKQKNQNLHEAIGVEKKMKEKYFEMWRASERKKRN